MVRTTQTTYGIYNNDAGELNINNCSISTSSSYRESYGIYNNSTSKINIYDGNINSSSKSSYPSYGIYNNSTGEIYVLKGTITTSSTVGSSTELSTCGIYNNENGIITLGRDDDEVSKTTPIISSTTSSSDKISYGVYNISGNFNFFDGKISATTSISGLISAIPKGYDIIKTSDGKIETAILDNLPIAQIENTTYTVLQDAFDAVEDNKETPTTVKLLRDVTILNEDRKLKIDNAKNIFLNMNGYTISSGIENGIENNGKLEIGYQEEEKFSVSLADCINNGEYYFVSNEDGSITPNNDTLANTTANSYIKIDLTTVSTKQKLILNAVTMSPTWTDYGYATITEDEKAPGFEETEGRFMYSQGSTSSASKDYEIELNGGKLYYLHLAFFRSATYPNGRSNKLKINSISFEVQGKIQSTNGDCITNNGDLIISDGVKLNSPKYAINNNGNLNIKGGEIEIIAASASDNIYGIYNSHTGKIEINGGTIYSSNSNARSIYNDSIEDINIYNGTLYGLYNNNTGTINIYNGNITATINNISSGNIIINDGNFQSIYNEGEGNITMLGGKILTTLYGIYNSSSGTIEVGTNDETIDETLPEISTTSTSESYGIYNVKGTFNFYDGKISGKMSIKGEINNIPENYDVIKTNINGYEIATIGNSPAAQVGDTTYNVLQDAFNSIEDNKEESTEVKLLRNVTILNNENKLSVPSSKNIYLNMNNFNLLIGNESGIENNGKLEIGDKIGEKDTNFTASDLITDGTYYFEDDGNGGFVSNNVGIDSSTASSYIKVDLSTLKGSFKLTINAEISSQYNGDIGYVIINNSIESPTYDSSEEKFININGTVSSKDYTMELEGENVYYLHFGYYKNYSSSSGDDIFKINTVKIESTGTLLASAGKCITNFGKLIIENGSKITSSSEVITYVIYNTDMGEVIINGGEILSKCSDSSTSRAYGIYNAGNNSININGGTIKVQSSNNKSIIYGIYNTTGEINMNNGLISIINDNSTTYGIYTTDGNINISNNATIYLDNYNNYSYSLYTQRGEINLNGGVIISTTNGYASYGGDSYGIYSNLGNITINKGTVESYSDRSSSYGIYINSGNMIITDGSISAIMTSNSSSYGIYNKAATITLTNTNITSYNYETSGSNQTYGIYNQGILNFISGSISSAVSDSSGYAQGIYNRRSATLGTNDGIINILSPNIFVTGKNTANGVFTTGTFNFYDGKINSQKLTINGKITEVAPGYEIKRTTQDGVITDILALSSTDNTVCVMNSVNYTKLEDAIAACTGTDEYTISLTNGCELTSPITIPSGKKITLSINGFDINYSGTDSMIINNGTLTIKDTNTVNSGEVLNKLGNVIENNGTLIIGENEGSVTARSPHIVGKETAIINKGTIQFYDGTITATTPISGTTIGTIPDDYTLVETTDGENKVLSLVGIAPSITYTTETVSEGTKIIVTATDTNLSKIVNPDNTEATGSATQIVSEYIATKSGIYTFRAIDQNNNVTTIDVAI